MGASDSLGITRSVLMSVIFVFSVSVLLGCRSTHLIEDESACKITNSPAEPRDWGWDGEGMVRHHIVSKEKMKKR